ncbi:hypothetical protein GCM10012286_79360 [Streptomyces lasiicapitis]|uniref:Uncharacterized protein n=1 Tax=Streptomyces lasiicapitis TaxID=1923961 RepID=A0ABQ2MVL4_9ACTN|nr:hypothetical protein GCM10012286_79360 [Streptomyces lasiicapitis]
MLYEALSLGQADRVYLSAGQTDGQVDAPARSPGRGVQGHAALRFTSVRNCVQEGKRAQRMGGVGGGQGQGGEEQGAGGQQRAGVHRRRAPQGEGVKRASRG